MVVVGHSGDHEPVAVPLPGDRLCPLSNLLNVDFSLVGAGSWIFIGRVFESDGFSTKTFALVVGLIDHSFKLAGHRR